VTGTDIICETSVICNYKIGLKAGKGSIKLNSHKKLKILHQLELVLRLKPVL
jgi:hypothetical protein